MQTQQSTVENGGPEGLSEVPESEAGRIVRMSRRGFGETAPTPTNA